MPFANVNSLLKDAENLSDNFRFVLNEGLNSPKEPPLIENFPLFFLLFSNLGSFELMLRLEDEANALAGRKILSF